MHVFLQTERLILREFAETDLDNLWGLNSDPDVVFYINGGRPYTRAEAQVELQRIMGYTSVEHGSGCWALVVRASSEFIGWIMLRAPRDGSLYEPELGYRLKKSAWDQGYATEASRAVIRNAFQHHAVQRIFATTMTVNVGSRRVMEKSGLRFVRTFFQEWPDKIPGDEHGDVEYALDRDQWEQDEAARALEQAT